MVISSFKARTVSNIKYVCFGIAILIGLNAFGQSTHNVKHFEKIIISPHIQVAFVEGDQESVIVDSNRVSNNKLTVKVKGNTLHMYLDGARTVTKSKKHKEGKWKVKQPIYKGTIVTATIIYKTINSLSLRGEERFAFKSTIQQDKLSLKVYGESQVSFNALNLKELHTTMYGAGTLHINSGSIDNNRTICYGECKVNSPDVQNLYSKVTAYGEGEFNLNVLDNLKVTAYGEAVVSYKGNPEINKGIILGEAKIRKTD